LLDDARPGRLERLRGRVNYARLLELLQVSRQFVCVHDY
jgi:hypothetical protein